ncbi:MAG: prolyl oligopeptidase family serine peptidase [Bacteroides sp.]|nr:prolyl oligopeptidase family serine peptidase [Bacteroides sp.]MDD4719504.1 prolyl oligopeptidase family serine peptidase [Bacteroides sp.]
MRKMTLLLLMSVLFIACQNNNKMIYPKTKKVDTIDVYFNTEVADPYRWLEDDTSDETAEWVKAQNKVTQSYLNQIPQRKRLKERLTQLMNYEKIGTPFKKGERYFFYRNDGLQNQSVLYVQNSLDDEPKVFLDPNKLSDDGTIALANISFSKDAKYVAYTVSQSGSDWRNIYVMDSQTLEVIDGPIEWAKFTGASWRGNGFYYSAYDAPEAGKEFSSVNENHKIYYHKVGTPQSEDQLVYANEKYPKRFYSAGVSTDEDLLFIYESGEGRGNALFLKPSDDLSSPLITMAENFNYQYYPIEVINNKIYIYTNYKAPKYRLMVTDVSKPQIENWKELIPETENVLSNAQVIGKQLILTYDQDASNKAYICHLDGKDIKEIKLPAIGSVGFSGNRDDKECFYSFTSFTQPGSTYTFDIEKNESLLYRSPQIDFDSDKFITQQLFFESKDGTQIPMFITHKKGLELNSNNPVYLYGYGGFNISLNPSFSVSRLPFLEQGGIYAQVNLRGGGEYGEDWHIAGTKKQKQNVFDDFISAAEYLIANKYTSTNKIAIVGGSNGGLLVGACMTQRPDLFQVAIPQVGVLDMLRYHKFTIGWNWASDYGTSEESPEMFKYLLGYSPLHNLTKGVSYPATLITTADHDDRVVPAHSFKFAAALQEANDGKNPTLIRIDTKAGHGAGKPTEKVIEEQSDIYGFIMYHLGMNY